MTEIKICGLTCEDDIKTVNELEVEYAGFVFVKYFHAFYSLLYLSVDKLRIWNRLSGHKFIPDFK